MTTMNMTTISVPMPKDLLQFIDGQIKIGEAENRAQAVRRALRKFREETEIAEIFEASRQAKEGLVYEGDLRQIIKMRKRKNG